MATSAFTLVDFCVGYRGVPITAGPTPQLVTYANVNSGIDAGTTAIGAGKEIWDDVRSELAFTKTGPYNVVTNWILLSTAASNVQIFAVLNGQPFSIYDFQLVANVETAISAPFASTINAGDKVSFTITASTTTTAKAFQLRVNSLGFL